MLRMLISHIYAGIPLSPVLGESVFAEVDFAVVADDEAVVVVEVSAADVVVSAGADVTVVVTISDSFSNPANTSFSCQS